MAVGIALLPMAWIWRPLAMGQVGLLVYLAGFTKIAAMMPIRWRRGMQTIDTMPLVAAALLLPGPGVVLIALLCTGYGRRNLRDNVWWKVPFNRAKTALECGIPSILAATLVVPSWVDIPLKTLLLCIGIVALGYPLTARALAFLERVSLSEVLFSNVGLFTVQSIVVLGFGGGALAMLLELNAGYLMGVGLLGLLWAVRSNMRDVQRQELEHTQTLELLAQALDARDPMTERHSQRVSDLAARIGTVLGWSGRELENLRTAGLLHDIGKIGVRDSILSKGGELTAQEWVAMRRHADLGADMIARHSAMEQIAPWVRFHHERWDGSGYPQGLIGMEAPLAARILAVADSYDTMTGPRVYRASIMTPRDAVTSISSSAGELFDPEVVDALRELHQVPPLKPRPKSDHHVAGTHILSGLALVRQQPRFRLFAGGMTVSSLGDPLTTVAIVVTVYTVSHAPLLVALIYGLRASATAVVTYSLGGLADRFDRRRVIVASDAIRAAILLAMPVFFVAQVWMIFVAVIVLAAAESIGQSARDAALPELAGPGEVVNANALIATATLITGTLGFGLAAAVLAAGQGIRPLFIVDACTFLVAALITSRVGYLGGALVGRAVSGSIRSTWSLKALRGPLTVAGLAAFFIAMAQPTMVLLAYRLWGAGPQALAVLEALIAVGLIAGNVILIAARPIPNRSLVLVGMGMMGAFSLAVALSSWLVLTAGLVLIASIGNAIYTVGNRSQLQELSRHGGAGRIMSARFMAVQVMAIAGYGVSGLIAAEFGPGAVFATLGAGLTLLAFSLLLRRSSIQPAGTWGTIGTPASSTYATDQALTRTTLPVSGGQGGKPSLGDA